MLFFQDSYNKSVMKVLILPSLAFVVAIHTILSMVVERLIEIFGLLGGQVVKALDCRPRGPRFWPTGNRDFSLQGTLSPDPKIEEKGYLRILQRGN